MISLHKTRALRPGTLRFRVQGVDGIDTDLGDRVTCSVWPMQSAGVRVLVTMSGAVNGVADLELPDVATPAAIDRDALTAHVVDLVARIHATLTEHDHIANRRSAS